MIELKKRVPFTSVRLRSHSPGPESRPRVGVKNRVGPTFPPSMPEHDTGRLFYSVTAEQEPSNRKTVRGRHDDAPCRWRAPRTPPSPVVVPTGSLVRL